MTAAERAALLAENRTAIVTAFFSDRVLTASGSYDAFTVAARARLETDPYWTFISQDERDTAAKKGQAMPTGGYPVRNPTELDKAIKAVGRGGADHDKIRRHIIKRAKSLGTSSKIPENWGADGSLKSSENAVTASGKTGMETDPKANTKPAVGDPKATAPAGASPPDNPADKAVASAIDDLTKALSAVVAAQADDPDITDPADQKVTELLGTVKTAIAALKEAQGADTDSTKTPPGATPTPPKAAAAAGRTATFTLPPTKLPPGHADTPPGKPAVGKGAPPKGDVENTVPCPNDNGTGEMCGHFASAHDDTDTGKNTGPCGMANCNCPSMLVPTQTPVSTGKDPDEGVGATPAQAEASARFAADDDQTGGAGDAGPSGGGDAGDAAGGGTSGGGSITLATAEGTGIPSGVAIGPAFTIPIFLVEGVPTSDKRMIQPESLSWRTPPLPLMALLENSAMGGHDKAFLAGTITSIERSGTTIMAKGNFHTTPEGEKACEALEQMGRMGLSADIGDVESIMGQPIPIDIGGPSIFAGDDEATDGVEETLIAGEIMGGTMCPFAAFPEAYIVLGDGSDMPAPIPLRAPTAEEASVVTPFHVLTADGGCEPCLGLEEGALTAAGGPLAPPRAWFEMAEPDELTPLTVTPDGRVFGHLAPWNECHTAFRGECVMAPRDHNRGYSSFRTGYVLTAEGDEIAIGPLTVGTGHADDRKSTVATLAHYDNTGTAVADVVPSDGKFGIWMCGALRPGATDDQIRTLRASPPSGDWRKLNGKLALYAVLAVNSPGFVTPRALVASGQVMSLVAAGWPTMHEFYETAMPGPEPSRFERLAAPIIARDLRDRMSRIG